MTVSLVHWLVFLGFVLVMLALDLGLFHKKHHIVSFKEALAWTFLWIALALGFSAWIWHQGGSRPGLEFLTGYLIEKSLSVDNIFVFVVIFSYFKIPPKYQHDVLFWGILGALIMRAIFIAAGISLLQRFHWLIYIFGFFLILTGIRLWREKGMTSHPAKNPLVRFLSGLMPVTSHLQGGRFFVKTRGRWTATPLWLALIVVETTDLIFAVDSIPAILAITQDPFTVYTSNVFAILGLRSLYFALAGVMDRFHGLHYGLSVILIFVGAKMTLVDVYKIPVLASLLVVTLILALSIGFSLLFPIRRKSGQQS